MSDDKPRIRVPATTTYRMDAWANAAVGRGTPGIDGALYSKHQFYNAFINWRTLSQLYRYDWLTRKICDRPAMDAVRRWLTGLEPDVIAELERLTVKKRLRTAISWARLYGGAAILLIVEDGLTPEAPLEPSRVRRVIDMPVVDRHHLQATGRLLDAYAVQYGEPEFYTTNNGTRFHHTRVLKFTGTDLTQDEAESEQYWGGSYVELYQQAAKDFQESSQDIRHMMTEAGIGVLKVPGLTEQAALGGEVFKLLQSRLDKFNATKSIYRTAGIDAEEEFEYKTRQLTSLPDLLDRYMTIVAGATDMTQLVLFGTTPGGLNASQEEQQTVYYDMVRGVQEDELMPALNKTLACITRGGAPEWEYSPLQEPSDQERADIRLKEAQAIAAISEFAMLSPETVVDHLNGTGHFALEGGTPDDVI